MDEKTKWYQKSWLMWIALIFFPPLGLVLLFFNRDKHTRWKIIGVVGILWMVFIWLPVTVAERKPHTPAPAVEQQQEVSAVEKDKAAIKEAIEAKLGDKVKKISVSEFHDQTYVVDFDMDMPSEDVEAAKAAAVAAIKDVSPDISQSVEQYRATLLYGGAGLATVTYNTEKSGNEGYTILRNGKTEKFDPNTPAPPSPAPSAPQAQSSSRQAPAAHVNNSDPGPNGETIKGNINSKGERIYHVPGGASYNKTIPEVWFFTEDEARAAGYRRAKR
mgnify:FL=1